MNQSNLQRGNAEGVDRRPARLAGRVCLGVPAKQLLWEYQFDELCQFLRHSTRPVIALRPYPGNADWC